MYLKCAQANLLPQRDSGPGWPPQIQGQECGLTAEQRGSGYTGVLSQGPESLLFSHVMILPQTHLLVSRHVIAPPPQTLQYYMFYTHVWPSKELCMSLILNS